MSRSKGSRRALVLAMSLGLLAGCENAMAPEEQIDVTEGLAPGIHPIVVLAGINAGTTDVQLHLRRVQVDATISSFQGELSYDTNAMTLKGAELPQAVMGAWNEIAPGKVRFAGAALEGVADAPVLTLHFEAKQAVQGNAFGVKMEEIVAATDFHSLTTQVVQREQPLFSRVPLRQ